MNSFLQFRIRSRRQWIAGSACMLVLLVSVFEPRVGAADDARERVSKAVAQIRRADYEGDRAALHRLHEELGRYTEKRPLAARVEYWRGFALWRSAINGFNESVDPKELENDMNLATADFDAALAADPRFADAMAGRASCLANLGFLSFKGGNAGRGLELIRQSWDGINAALAIAPENPRTLWVRGANEAYTPPERGGGPAIAMATFEKALKLARQQKGSVSDPLEPSWGEPELLMTLAFAKYNFKPPDLPAADRFAQDALAQVPYWHYVRDILIPQIRAAQAKQQN